MMTTTLEERWLPKSVLCLRNYDINKVTRDLIAGVTVGLVALPLAMAFSPKSAISRTANTGFPQPTCQHFNAKIVGNIEIVAEHRANG